MHSAVVYYPISERPFRPASERRRPSPWPFDLLLIDAGSSGPQHQRLLVWPLAELPLSCDSLVLTPREHAELLASGSAMAAARRWVLNDSSGAGATGRPWIGASGQPGMGNFRPHIGTAPPGCFTEKGGRLPGSQGAHGWANRETVLAVRICCVIAEPGLAKAVLTYNIFQSAGNVGVRTSGSLNLAGATSLSTAFCGNNRTIFSASALICAGVNIGLQGYRIAGSSGFSGTGFNMNGSSIRNKYPS